MCSLTPEKAELPNPTPQAVREKGKDNADAGIKTKGRDWHKRVH